MNDGFVRFASIPPRKMLRDVRMAAMKGRVWMNAINVEADHGTTERALYAAFYGEDHDWDNAGWREMAAFSSCVLRPLEWADANPDHSLLSVQRQAGLPMDLVRANIKLAISGGQNEARDAIAGTAWALLTHRDQLECVLAGEATWLQAFEEFARWMSLIGMSPRQVAKRHQLHDVTFEKGDCVFLMFGSGNRDETVFSNPDNFDIRAFCTKSESQISCKIAATYQAAPGTLRSIWLRLNVKCFSQDSSAAIAFGAGPHFCAGAWASKALIADVALPMLFDRLKGLTVTCSPQFGGWAFRGPLSMLVEWRPSG